MLYLRYKKNKNFKKNMKKAIFFKKIKTETSKK